MIHDAFYEVEEAPPDYPVPDERRERIVGMASKQEHNAEHEDEQGGDMEQAVSQRVRFQAPQCCRRINIAEHVVPLKHLVENDSVEQSSEADTSEYRGQA